MTRRRLLISATVLVTMGACGGATERVATQPSKVAPAVIRTGPLLLAQFDHGVGAVTAGDENPIWTDAAAVAAPDGSAVFSIRHDSTDRLVRLDRETGAVTSSWPLRSGVSISAVAPAGRWVALTDRQPGYGGPQGRASTEVVVFDPGAGSETRRLTLTGDVQPEAFSIDGKLIFALDYRGDHYRVQTIQLATGERYDTSDRDKTVTAEDMHGVSVRGVMSADHTLLATLYRNPGNADEPAFVHVLDLDHGWSYCADLPSPFGTGPVGSDSVELTHAGTVVVATTQAPRVAEIHIDEVRTPGTTPVTIEFRANPTPPVVPAYASAPGFRHLISVVSS